MFAQILIFLLYIFSFDLSLRCGNNYLPKQEIIPLSIKSSSENKRTLRDDNKLLVYFDFNGIDHSDITDEYKEFLKKNLNEAGKLISKIFSLKSPSQRITLEEANIKRCGAEFYDEEITTTGIDCDLLIFPIIDNSFAEMGVEAAATPCLVTEEEKRPYVGKIYLTNRYDTKRKNAEEYFKILLIHEMSHVLGFIPHFFEGHQKEIEQNGIKKTLLTFPTMLEKAKKYFNCDSMIGVHLEDQGGEGTSGSHWEQRIMNGDYMIGSEIGEHSISEITLAVFEDLGWYKINYYTGGLFRYGKNKGCEFLNNKCVENGNTDFSNEFCIIQDSPRCFSGRTSKGYCFMQQYKTLQDPYKYFGSDNNFAGPSYADYCPITYSNTNSEIYYPESCNGGTPQRDYEYIGKDSFCFISSLNKKGEEDNYYSICLKVNCDFPSRTYEVEFNNEIIFCKTEGEITTLDLYNGTFYCPDFNTICTSYTMCNNMIDCIEKEAEPYPYNLDYSDYEANPLNGQPAKEKPTEEEESIKLINFNLLVLFSLVLLLI
ncbi:MAG: hypothetical protein MJ252_05245 [archaeon]|nr:hypothetical protein [archaeon]